MAYYLELLPQGRTKTFETVIQTLDEARRLEGGGQLVGKLVDTNQPKPTKARRVVLESAPEGAVIKKVPYVKGDIELGPICGPFEPPNPPRKKRKLKRVAKRREVV